MVPRCARSEFGKRLSGKTGFVAHVIRRTHHIRIDGYTSWNEAWGAAAGQIRSTASSAERNLFWPQLFGRDAASGRRRFSAPFECGPNSAACRD